ncbi:MAG: hypothetical protein J5I93_05345 [Pirellulaceae bacterium]|nr:hypothetical protein [Pirellulaceae bacterium]
MTRAKSAASNLLVECYCRDVRLTPTLDGLLDIDAPRGVLTPGLLDRLRRYKPELLDLLTCPTPADAAEGQPHGADRADDVYLPEAPPPGPEGWPVGCIDPTTLQPCSACGRLELWQSLTGTWHCLHCDAPVVADRLRERASQLRNRYTSGPRARDIPAD